MASDDAVNQHNTDVEKSNDYETSTDRSLLDFMKKDDQDESKVITTEFDDKLHVSYPEPKFEDCSKVEEEEKVTKPSLLEKPHVSETEPKFEECSKVEEEEKVTKPSLLEKLHRSDNINSSSSDEEVEEGGEKKKNKKGLKEQIGEKIHKDDHKEEDTYSAPVEVVTEPEEKKGFMEKIKDMLPAGGAGKNKVEEETTVPLTAPVECGIVEGGEPAKKGTMEKIKDKLPGGGNKLVEEETTVAPWPTPAAPVDYSTVEGTGEPPKKGIMEKIKEKMPGHHHKTSYEEELKKEKDDQKDYA